MSELINIGARRADFRWQLLTTASALALITNASLSDVVNAEDSDHPTIWIELGGQLERIDGAQQPYAPPFTEAFSASGFMPLEKTESSPRYGNGLEGSMTFEPSESNWVFSASLKYGRSNAEKSSHNQTSNPPSGLISIPILHLYQPIAALSRQSADINSRNDESHTVLDFQVGRDVGVGVLGRDSTLSLGVRFAQFTTKTNAQITADSGPEWGAYKYIGGGLGRASVEYWDLYHANAQIDRSFRGIGPSLAFNGLTPLIGDPDGMQVDLDFGVNGAILFGRQKAKIHQATSDDEPVYPRSNNFIVLTPVYHHSPRDSIRSRSIIVPNIGGFAGLSFNYANAKIKLGYRADFFFGAMDGGIDTRKTYDRNFYGPFATISIGFRNGP